MLNYPTKNNLDGAIILNIKINLLKHTGYVATIIQNYLLIGVFSVATLFFYDGYMVTTWLQKWRDVAT